MATADIPDIKERISNRKDKVSDRKDRVAQLENKAKKANKKLDKANSSLGDAKDALGKAKKRQKKAGKKLKGAESDADAARDDLSVIQFGANVARTIQARTESNAASDGDTPGLIDVASADTYAAEQPSLVNLAVDTSSAEREATMSAVQADWEGAGARAELREANQAVSKATTKRDELAKAKKKAANVAGKANKRLDKAENKLDKAQNKLDSAEHALAKAVERKRERAAEKAAREAANRIASPGTGHTTSPYGMRTHPITGVYKLHSGTDFSYGDGRAYAAKSGTVAAVTYDNAYGNMVTISHGNGIQSRYAHLASPSVSSGEKVSAGDVVGQIGSTGYSTGPHLHFEVLKNGDFVNADNWLGQ